MLFFVSNGLSKKGRAEGGRRVSMERRALLPLLALLPLRPKGAEAAGGAEGARGAGEAEGAAGAGRGGG